MATGVILGAGKAIGVPKKNHLRVPEKYYVIETVAAKLCHFQDKVWRSSDGFSVGIPSLVEYRVSARRPHKGLSASTLL
jgi:hypothetical protein